MREMPIGEQSFEKLRNNQQVYVDKTALVYKLVKSNNPFFLTRPRRFGKSLLISTLEAYFKGKSGLFEGLAIVDLEQDWIEYPVIHIDLSGANYKKHSSNHASLMRLPNNFDAKPGVRLCQPALWQEHWPDKTITYSF